MGGRHGGRGRQSKWRGGRAGKNRPRNGPTGPGPPRRRGDCPGGRPRKSNGGAARAGKPGLRNGPTVPVPPRRACLCPASRFARSAAVTRPDPPGGPRSVRPPSSGQRLISSPTLVSATEGTARGDDRRGVPRVEPQHLVGGVEGDRAQLSRVPGGEHLAEPAAAGVFVEVDRPSRRALSTRDTSRPE